MYMLKVIYKFDFYCIFSSLAFLFLFFVAKIFSEFHTLIEEAAGTTYCAGCRCFIIWSLNINFFDSVFNKNIKQLTRDTACGLVIGDRGTGKSTLFSLIANEGLKDGMKVYF